MKKLGKSSKKGFTLVELIVVLVILAVLAAMLVPALIGYIDRAKAEKEYQTAATVYAAAQAVITEKYAKDELGTKTSISKGDFKTADGKDYVLYLAGVDENAVSAYTFNFDTSTHIVTTGSTVNIGNAQYTLTITGGVPSWSGALQAGSGADEGGDAEGGNAEGGN